MKKILPYIFIAVLLVGVFAPHVGHAQSPQLIYQGYNYVAQKAGLTTGIGDIAGNAFASVLDWVAYLLLRIMALILWIAGVLLDFVLTETIIKMSTNISSFTGINIAWKVIRDLMNIGFIFLLIWEAIELIVSQSNTSKVRDFVVAIVVTAILVNFSLFFTKALIDVSNVVTIGFYKNIIDNSKQQVEQIGGPEAKAQVTGLSVPFVRALRISSVYSGDVFAESASAGAGNSTNALIIDLAGCILFLITSFVFLAVTCMFVIRYVVLLVLLMISPIGFVWKDAIPKIGEYRKEWWKSLQGQLLFGPIYMLMTWLVLTLMASPGFIFQKNATGNWASLIISGHSDTDSLSLILNFAVIIGLAIASLVIAKKFATQGSNLIGDAVGKVTAFAGDTVLGGVAKGFRSTVGRAGQALSESERLKDRAAKGGALGFLAKQTMSVGEKGAKSTFDVRASSVLGSGLAQAGAGKVDKKKQTFDAEMKAKIKAEEDFTKKLKPSDAEVERRKEETKEERERLDREQAETAKQYSQSDKELKELSKNRARAEEEKKKATSMEARAEADVKIKAIEDEIRTKQENTEKLKAASEAAAKKFKEEEDKIKNIFKDRAESYAKTFEDESGLWRWGKNVAKFATTAGIPVSQSDNNKIAEKVRKAAGAKTDEEEVLERLKKMAKKEVEKENEDKEEKPKETEEKKEELKT